MSLHDYKTSQQIGAVPGVTFAALIMAAMRQADTANTQKLRDEWPEIYDELRTRYHAPGGFLEGERRPEA